jgi:DNA-binding NarL/FixJ family response regulator
MISLKILIADDKPLVRCGLRMLVEGHERWIVCGEAADGLEAVEKAANLKPDVVLLDISMPKLDGLSAVPLIREQLPDSDIVILTLHDSIEMARMAANAGAQAYITKSRLSTELMPAIETLRAAHR